MQYKHMLITGGAGFIGSNFTRYCCKNFPALQITVLDALTYAGNKANLSEVADKITFIEGDITNSVLVQQVMQDVDVVVHFAAESHVDRSILDPLLFVKTNVLGTAVLLEAAKSAGVKRFHHVSTDEVYGSLPLESKVLWTEATAYNPRSPYSASKAGSDHLVMSYALTYGLPVTLSNCTNNYGPYMHPEKLFAKAITNLLQGKKVPVFTPGNQVREWLWVEDHCSAIALILDKGRPGEKYHIAPREKDITNMQAIKVILQELQAGEDMIELVAERAGHDQKYAVSSEKIYRELGWEAKTSFEDGIRLMIAWYKANQSWWLALLK